MVFRYLDHLFTVFYLLFVFSAYAQKPLPDASLAVEPGVLGGLTVEVKGLVGGFESVPKYSVILLFKNAGGAVQLQQFEFARFYREERTRQSAVWGHFVVGGCRSIGEEPCC